MRDRFVAFWCVTFYVPFESTLVIPVKALLQNRWFAGIDRYDAALPEVLLLLILQAALERWNSEKGSKTEQICSHFSLTQTGSPNSLWTWPGSLIQHRIISPF